MKFYACLLSLISISSFANIGSTQEEVYITSLKDLDLIKTHSALTIDHVSHDGFELYGPTGMKEWLNNAGISYRENQTILTKNKSSIDYPSFAEVEKNLKTFVAMNPSIAKLFSIGKSVDGRDLWVVKISDNVEIDEVEPEFKYISSMHGDEITGRELTQFLIRDLIAGYGVDQKITDLINNTEIFIMPSMNPDGSKRRQRGNAKNVDLNRNFPDWTINETNTGANRQIETIAVMDFQKSRNFSLSANFHGGSVVVNYPWDSSYERHPFDGLLQDLSLIYADENPAMRGSREFNRGITNGADWYVVKGGMQDWSYFWYNDLQVTVELSDTKWPSYRYIPAFYQDNKQSMINFVEAIHQGAGFKITNSINKSGAVKISKVLNDGSRVNIGKFGFSRSEFYKVLSVGEYVFDIEINGESNSKSYSVVVENKISENGNYLILN